MTSIHTVALEVPDPVAADVFYSAAFDLGARLDLRAVGSADERVSWVHAVARGIPASDSR